MNNKKYLITIDQGTSATKAVLFDHTGKVAYRLNAFHKQFYPQIGWVEQDANEILQNTCNILRELLVVSGINASEISALTITNQTGPFVLWDRATGEPVYRAIGWQCTRAGAVCREMEKKSNIKIVLENSGAKLSAYSSSAKLKWLFDNKEGLYERAKSGELLFGTMDCWLIWKLTGGKIHATDYTNAACTQLFNIYSLSWDHDLLELFGIPSDIMPATICSDADFGITDIPGFKGIPITGVIGDSSGALFGQRAFEKGSIKATYGSGSSLMMNIGSIPLKPGDGLSAEIAWGLAGETTYACVGSSMCTGATVLWLVDTLELIEDSAESESIALTVPDNGGVYLVPAFVGLGTPYWDSDARGCIVGLSRGTGKAHVVRAALEGIAYVIKDMADVMIKNTGIQPKNYLADGGASRNSFLMQFQADMLGSRVIRSEIEESSALGSAYIGGLATNIWRSKEEILKLDRLQTTFYPKISEQIRNKYYRGWKEALKKSFSEGFLK